MSLESFGNRYEHDHAGKQLAISDHFIQLELMKLVFAEEQKSAKPEERIDNPTRRQIAEKWMEKHAKHWRHVIETHEADIVDTSDPSWVTKCYNMLKEDESGPTIH